MAERGQVIHRNKPFIVHGTYPVDFGPYGKMVQMVEMECTNCNGRFMLADEDTRPMGNENRPCPHCYRSGEIPAEMNRKAHMRQQMAEAKKNQKLRRSKA